MRVNTWGATGHWISDDRGGVLVHQATHFVKTNFALSVLLQYPIGNRIDFHVLDPQGADCVFNCKATIIQLC